MEEIKKLKMDVMGKDLVISKKDLEIEHLKFAPHKNIALEK